MAADPDNLQEKLHEGIKMPRVDSGMTKACPDSGHDQQGPGRARGRDAHIP